MGDIREHIGSRNVDAIIRRIINAAHNSLELDIVFQEIVDGLGMYLQADRCFISCFDSETGKLSPPTLEYRSSNRISSMLDADPELWESLEEFAQTLSHSNKPVEFDDATQGVSQAARHQLAQINAQSGLGCIICFRGTCQAVLFIHQVTQTRHWTEFEKGIVELAATESASAIYQAKLYEILQIRNRRQEKTSQLFRNVITGIDLETLFNQVMGLVCDELELQFCKIIEYIPDSGHPLLVRAVKGFDQSLVGQKFDPGAEPHSAYTLASKDTILVKDIYQETRFKASPIHYEYKLISGLSAVIYGEHELFGVLEVDSQVRRTFSEEDIDLLNQLANVIGIAVERHTAEVAIRETQERFRLLVENTKDYAIYLKDSVGHITSWNPGAERIFGYSGDEVIGQHFSMFMTPEDKKIGIPEREIKIAAEEGRFEIEGWRIKKDGTLFWSHVVAEAVRDENSNLIGLTNIVRDMTERRQSEQALQHQHELLRSVMDNATSAIFMLDTQGHFTFINRAAEDITGYPATALHGQSIYILLQKPPIEDSTHLIESNALVQALLLQKQAIQNMETTFIRKDGNPYPVMCSATPITEEATQQGIILEVRDITEEKKAQQDLKTYTEKLEQSNKDLELFAAMASHDLQAPLRKIRFFGDHLYDIAKHKLDEEALDDLSRMRKSIENMQRLVDDFLALAKVSKKGKVEFQDVDLLRVVHKILIDFTNQIREKQAQVEIGPLITLKADQLQIEQLLHNLIGNALKFHRPDVTPIIKISSGFLDESTCQLSIEDNGIGFPQDQADRIFEPLERLHGKSRYEGSGVGLAICKRIVERHGGSIRAFSKPGEGATFTVTLPLNPISQNT